MSLADSIPEPEPEPESDSILCWPEPSQRGLIWTMLGCALGYGAMSLLAARDYWTRGSTPGEGLREGPREGPEVVILACILFGSMLLLSLAVAAWAALRIRRGFIIADAVGLRWRAAGRVREAKWTDVSDLYFTRSSSSHAVYVAETSAGRLSFGSEWSRDQELALFIERQASNALSNASGEARVWRAKRAEPRWEWPLRLSYRGFDNRFVMPAVSLLCLGCLAAEDWQLAASLRNTGPGGGASSVGEIVNLYGWPFALLMGAFLGLMVMGAPAAVGVVFFRFWLDARQRSHHLIEARPEGIAWTDGSRTVVSTWDAVRRIETPGGGHLAAARTIVQTDNGEFDFTQGLSRSVLLLRLIRERAHNVPAQDWEPRPRQSEGPIRDGDGLLFNYRNRSSRFFAWCVTALLMMPVAAVWLRSVAALADPDFLKNGVPWPLIVAGVALCAGVWRCYYTAWIRTDERGITQSGALGQKFVAWQGVTKYLRGESGIVVEGQGADGRRVAVRFQVSISGADELMDEIEARATNSQNRAWRHNLPPVGAESLSAPSATPTRKRGRRAKYL